MVNYKLSFIYSTSIWMSEGQTVFISGKQNIMFSVLVKLMIQSFFILSSLLKSPLINLSSRGFNTINIWYLGLECPSAQQIEQALH